MPRTPTPVARVLVVPSFRDWVSKILFHAAAVCALALYTIAAHAQLAEPTELVDQQHCMFCHTSDAPFLAPSFHQIAERYRDKPNASTLLEDKLRHGGKAHWGDMAMPLPDDRGGPLSAEDARTLVQWVLSQ
ncbi:cytochrome C [Paraburkholderia sp. CNPSo 3274]|uniref:c-type cytochrome n=1 Tax=Paraburkholderia sp. CNPSo 3274 TaxID=2940932 RepID=UPI0020B81950|nr:c-type cytochrome [Paraburkholderia sp. CNPSo 3274]MCP3710055.1 cytochrome C [Paraburkholderia sp. CNPSo 3274]